MVPPGDPETMARSIQAVLDRPDKYVVPAQVLQPFTVDAAVNAYEELIGRIVSARR
jgi:hypothetical protein